MKTELLAPAGDLDCAYAAFHYGADAIYLGLKRFSARAEAANFSVSELSEITAFAHAATPRRSVFVAMNTLIMDDELDDAVESLATVAAVGVDAVIIQDLGLARLAREHFPRLERHASTQLAVHNVEGARAAKALGFSRVTLARELTLREVETIVNEGGLPVESFIHGALCYSVSGLCLYSSLLRGRSGNRGRCAYPCREAFGGCGDDEAEARYPFSMKDLALAVDVLKAREAGVFSFKIEGRKKSALYVAAVTRYYRSLLDRTLSADARREAEEDIKTIFSRPWTPLYAKTERNRAVTDAEIVGHRGAPIGEVEEIIRQGDAEWVRFRTTRRMERHDGIQTDVPGQGRPFGFPVDRLCVVGRRGRKDDVFEADAGEVIEVMLPREHPVIQPGAPLYCSSSQSVKQKYRFPAPKPGAFKVRTPIEVVVTVTADALQAAGTTAAGVSAKVSVAGHFEVSRAPGKIATSTREAFEKLGETAFSISAFTIENPEELFVPVSMANQLRRDLMTELSNGMENALRTRIRTIQGAECARRPSAPDATPRPAWSIKVDRLGHLNSFGKDEAEGLEEILLEVHHDPLAALIPGLNELSTRVGRERITLSLPLMVRDWERNELLAKVVALKEAGWSRWEAGSIWGLPETGHVLPGETLGTDWPVYVSNRSAARSLVGMGITRFVLSPEADGHSLQPVLAQFPEQAVVIVYQDTPLFISENCALAAMAGACPAGPECKDSERDWISASGENVRLVQRGCRSVLINRTPFCLAGRMTELLAMGTRHLRADFVWRRYEPDTVVTLLRRLRRGDGVRGHEGNFMRGLA